MYDEFLEQGIDEIYCVSVNDSFTMNAWFKSIGINNVKALPDGSGDFTRALGMLVKKDNLGFGMRSWRYSAIVQDGLMTDMFVEAGMQDNASEDPFLVSDAYTMMDRCKAIKADK
jgi:peroxiredoxin|tara:strand:+ start:458 stop:802 length:345 start_codon:yes stop_codon:yes gene_type:complete